MAWEAGGYIKPGNRQSGEFWWGALGGSTAGQFRRIVVNKSVVKPSCDQLLSGDEGEGGTWSAEGDRYLVPYDSCCILFVFGVTI